MKETKFASIGTTRSQRRIPTQSRDRFDMALRVVEAQGKIPTAKGVRQVLKKLTGYGMDTWILNAIMRDHIRHREKTVEPIVRDYKRLSPFERNVLWRLLRSTGRKVAR